MVQGTRKNHINGKPTPDKKNTLLFKLAERLEKLETALKDNKETLTPKFRRSITKIKREIIASSNKLTTKRISGVISYVDELCRKVVTAK